MFLSFFVAKDFAVIFYTQTKDMCITNTFISSIIIIGLLYNALCCSSLSWCGRGADLHICCLVAGPTQLPRAGVARALCLHAPLCCIKASPLLNKSLVLLSQSFCLAEVGF